MERESWQRAGLTRDEWIVRVLSRAGDRRELARFYAESGNVEAARQLMRSALARELHVAGLREDVTPAETELVAALLPTWTGSSSKELLATARDILANQEAAS